MPFVAPLTGLFSPCTDLLTYCLTCCMSQVLEGKPIYADCFGNLVPLTKSGQHHLFSFFAFKENRLALFIKVSIIALF